MTALTSGYTRSARRANLSVELALLRVAAQLVIWTDRRTQRRQLASLSAGQLEDIGISREQAMQESAKPFWVL